MGKPYSGNFRARDFKCWSQLVQLFFGQITSLESLRSICTCLQAHEGQLYHLSDKQSVDHTTLSRANENREWPIFADFGEYLIVLARPLCAELYVYNVNRLSGFPTSQASQPKTP